MIQANASEILQFLNGKEQPAALNPTVAAFRPQRNAAVAARAHIQELAQMDDENFIVIFIFTIVNSED